MDRSWVHRKCYFTVCCNTFFQFLHSPDTTYKIDTLVSFWILNSKYRCKYQILQ